MSKTMNKKPLLFSVSANTNGTFSLYGRHQFDRSVLPSEVDLEKLKKFEDWLNSPEALKAHIYKIGDRWYVGMKFIHTDITKEPSHET